MELKHIDFSKNEIPANGTVYKVKYSLTAERWKHFEKYQNHYAFGLSFSEIKERLDSAIQLGNQGKGIEAWNLIYNLKEGIAYRLEDREHPMLLLCSLFVVTDDEDLTTWSEAEQKKKLSDWNKEGYDVDDFFVLASNLVKNFLPSYEEIFPGISQKDSEKAKYTSKRPSK